MQRTRHNGRVKAKVCFYYEQDRLLAEEINLVRIIVGSLVDYLTLDQEKFLIAGIGGTLRDKTASDIDIGVVGFKYAGNHQKFADEFTQKVENYFARLALALNQMRACGEGVSRKAIGLLEEGVGKLYRLHKEKMTVQLELSAEDLSRKGSKSIEFKAEDCRPIHIHFFYGEGIQEWMKAKGEGKIFAPLMWKGLPEPATKELDALNNGYNYNR